MALVLDGADHLHFAGGTVKSPASAAQKSVIEEASLAFWDAWLKDDPNSEALLDEASLSREGAWRMTTGERGSLGSSFGFRHSSFLSPRRDVTNGCQPPDRIFLQDESLARRSLLGQAVGEYAHPANGCLHLSFGQESRVWSSSVDRVKKGLRTLAMPPPAR